MMVGMRDLLLLDCQHKIIIFMVKYEIVLLMHMLTYLIPWYLAEHLLWVTLSTESKWTDD